MRKEILALQGAGCDVKGALERCVGDENFYLECLQDSLADEAFDALPAALAAGRVRAAFDAAHLLKGLLANMGLTPMMPNVVKIVEPLRPYFDQAAGLPAEPALTKPLLPYAKALQAQRVAYRALLHP